MTKTTCEALYNILMKYGASPAEQDYFVFTAVDAFMDNSMEWRFRGVFGFGGKLRFNKFRSVKIYADYYAENSYPELDKKLEALNSELAAFCVANNI